MKDVSNLGQQTRPMRPTVRLFNSEYNLGQERPVQLNEVFSQLLNDFDSSYGL